MTAEQILSIYKNFNNLYFDNELPLPDKIEFKCVKSVLGQFKWYGSYIDGGRFILRMSTAYRMSDFEIEKVVIHEMIHVWQWMYNYKDSHGKSFKYKAAEINSKTDYKYEISRLTTIKNAVSIKDENKCYNGIIMVYDDSRRPGKKIVTLCTKKSIEYFRTWFTIKPVISNIKYYTVSGKFYNNKKKSIRVVHGYKYSKSDFEKFIVPTIQRDITPIEHYK